MSAEIDERWERLHVLLKSMGSPPSLMLSLESVICPTKTRISLLTWLLSLFSVSLVPSSSSDDPTSTSRLMELVNSIHVLGFCSANDMVTIQGCPSGIMDLKGCQKQMTFLENLIHFIAFSRGFSDAAPEEEISASQSVIWTVSENRRKIFSSKNTLTQSFPADILDDSPGSLCPACPPTTFSFFDATIPEEPQLREIERHFRYLKDLNEKLSNDLQEVAQELERERETWMLDKLPTGGNKQARGKEAFDQMGQEFRRFGVASEEFNHIFEHKIKTWIRTDSKESLQNEESELGRAIVNAEKAQRDAVEILEWIRETKKNYSTILCVGEFEEKNAGGAFTPKVLFDLQKKTQILTDTLSVLYSQ